MDLEAPPTPPDSPLTMEDVLSSPRYVDLRTAKLGVGDPAYMFELATPSGAPLRLADVAAGRPAALVFGSFT